MPCDSQTLLAAAVANGYFKLSDRDVLAGIAEEYALDYSSTIPAGYALAASNGYFELSEEDLLQAWLTAACASGCDATTIYANAVAQGMPKLSDRDLWLVILQSVCSGSCDAASVESATMLDGGAKLSERALLETIVALACQSNCAADTIEATSYTTNKYAKLSKRMILECLAYEICTNPPSGGGGNTPTNFTFTILQQTSQIASAYTRATWDPPGGGVISTELWTSTDNVTFVLAATVAAPGVSVVVESGSNPFYGKVRFVTGSGNGPFTAASSINYGTDFSARVVANGGAAPSAPTIAALNTWYDSSARGGHLKKIYSIICPMESLAISFTPLVGIFGFPFWTNHNFVIGNLTINGLIGDGASKYLETGVDPTDIQAGQDPFGTPYPLLTESFWIAFYDTASSNSLTTEFGAHSNTPTRAVYYDAQYSGTTYFADPDDGVGTLTSYVTTNGERLGVGNRIANNVAEMYDLIAGVFVVQQTNATSVLGQPIVAVPFYAWGTNSSLGIAFSNKRGSLCGCGYGMTRADWQAFAPICRQLRTDLGGGDP